MNQLRISGRAATAVPTWSTSPMSSTLSQGSVEKHISSIFATLGLNTPSDDDHRRVLAVLAWLGAITGT